MVKFEERGVIIVWKEEEGVKFEERVMIIRRKEEEGVKFEGVMRKGLMIGKKGNLCKGKG